MLITHYRVTTKAVRLPPYGVILWSPQTSKTTPHGDHKISWKKLPLDSGTPGDQVRGERSYHGGGGPISFRSVVVYWRGGGGGSGGGGCSGGVCMVVGVVGWWPYY